MPIIEKALELLKKREFVVVATADIDAKPNSAPKLLLRTEGRVVYFIDYSIGTTAENLRENPRISFSFMDMDTLSGYRFYGIAAVIEEGNIYDACLKELRERKIQLSVERIIKGVQSNMAHKEFELDIPERILVYRVRIEEASEITPRGEIKKESGR